ncbi:MAG TPA: ribulokinase [Solirubrobacteraceae bacterium]|nr:ribulokinase [Solirubrobacteraceae bacterium]
MAAAGPRRKGSRGAGGPYALGVDFGTESGRVVALDLRSGSEAAVAVVRYASGVIDRSLPETGELLPGDWALQDPDDWLAVLELGIPAALESAGIAGASVIGIGIDFTCCTVLPVTADGTPLCRLAEWRERPHAWPKLWKHHAAQPVADRLTEVALERGEAFLARYGGRISSEWYFPKLIEIWLEDRAVYDASAGFVEACDWIAWQLGGREARAACAAGYKALWSPDDGLPSRDYFAAAYPGFDDPAAKLGSAFHPLGARAGTLRPELAARLGLHPDVAVAVGNVDSFVSVPGAGVLDPSSFLIVIGTSICDVVVHPDEVLLPGITGVVRDGVLPGLYGYEAGQAAVGDMLGWFVGLFDAERDGGRYADFEREAAVLAPGATGLLALDWWNGNRTILADADLSGVLAGITLQTTAHEIYRALLESIAFGNRRIVDNFEEHGLRIDQLVACGGIAEKSPLTMQLLADASGRRVSVPASNEVPARGAALFGAVAAGAPAGGFADIMSAIAALSPGTAATYEPDPGAVAVYDDVYALYRELHDTLGRERVELLHGLKRIRERGAEPEVLAL